MKGKNPYSWLRWIAHISGTLLVAFTLTIAVGEFMEGQSKNAGLSLSAYTPLIRTIFFIWGIALASLILALWNEGSGGIISLVSFLLMYILNLFNSQASMRADALFVFLFFSIPSILYLVHWRLNKDTSPKA